MKNHIPDPKFWESFVMSKKQLLEGDDKYSPKAYQDLMQRFNEWAANNNRGIMYDEKIGYRAVERAQYSNGDTLADLPMPGFKKADDVEVKRLKNKAIKDMRAERMADEADPLKYDYEEALARGDKKSKELKALWLAKKDEIRADLPYEG